MGKNLSLLVLFLFLVACASNEQHKRKAHLHYQLGTSYLMDGHYPKALKELFKAEQLAPKDPYIKNNIALVFLGKADFKKAKSFLLKAIELKADFSDAYNNLAALSIYSRDWNAVIMYGRKALENPIYHSPQKPHTNMGWAYYKLSDYRAAEKRASKSHSDKQAFLFSPQKFRLGSLQTKKALCFRGVF